MELEEITDQQAIFSNRFQKLAQAEKGILRMETSK